MVADCQWFCNGMETKYINALKGFIVTKLKGYETSWHEVFRDSIDSPTSLSSKVLARGLEIHENWIVQIDLQIFHSDSPKWTNVFSLQAAGRARQKLIKYYPDLRELYALEPTYISQSKDPQKVIFCISIETSLEKPKKSFHGSPR